MKRKRKGEADRSVCSESYRAILAANDVSEASLAAVVGPITRLDDLEFADPELLTFVREHALGCLHCKRDFENGLLDRLLGRNKGCLKSQRHNWRL